MNAPPVTVVELAFASALVLANALLSLLFEAGLARTLVVAAVRAIVQLLLVGVVLTTVFALSSPWLVALVTAVMLCTASFEIQSRQERRLRGLWRIGLGGSTMLLATLVVGALALAMVRPHPFYDPHVAIPLIGLLLGSIMNGVSISLNAFNVGIVRERPAIEAQLALGATRAQALKPLQRNALRSGMIPVVNQMSAAGIITLPGMMSGQILAGMDPLAAAKYQILVLLLLSAGAGFGAFATVAAATWRVTDDRHRLRLERLAVD
jgi:putative ABC transport system permease protein